MNNEMFKFYIRNCIYKIFKLLHSNEIKKLRNRYQNEGLESIPIFIINYNRLSYLINFIQQLERRGLYNIHIIDNKSSYEPLLEYYKVCPYKVHYMNKNYGHLVFWKCEEFREYRQYLYIVTDPDLEFIKDCPDDFVDKSVYLLFKYPFVQKIGLSLKIDDLPDTEFASKIIEWESQYYKTYIKKDNIYYAGIDTTFAVYTPQQLIRSQKFLSAFRMGYPYQMKHLPWYKKATDITEEDMYYSNHKTNGWSDPVKGFIPDNEQEKGVENK